MNRHLFSARALACAHGLALLLALIFVAAPATAQTQTQTAAIATIPARGLGVSSNERRIALVIGNDNYHSVSKLQNAGADARAIAASLEKAGFTVTLRLDLGERAMKEAVRSFKAQINGGDVAVFYYAGHGVQLGAANYLLPTDIKGDSEDQVKDEAVPLQRVLDDLQDQKAKFSLAIIDACRNNPFAVAGRRTLGGRGLAPTTAATGQMVLFSAGAGQQALDKVGPDDKSNNGLFTRVLLAEMGKPGVSIDVALRDVREQVVAAARAVNHEQVPAIYDQSVGRFYMHGGNNTAANTAATTPPVPAPLQVAMGNIASPRPVPPAALPASAGINPEDAMWGEVKASGAKEYYDAYLKQYPKGKYIALARIELKRITDQEQAQRALEVAQRAQAAQQAEQQAWEQAKSANTPDSYASFISTWPRAANVVLAQAAQERLRREAAEQERLATAQREREARQATEARLANEARLAAEARDRPRPGQTLKDCDVCPEVVVLPGGSFQMGSNEYSNEQPIHRVSIKGFALGKTEVTQGQWKAVMGSNPSGFSSCGDNCPVERVSWNDAQAYIAKLNARSGKQYRLPSEAEWEYAARAGSTGKWSFGDDESQLSNHAWFGGNSGSKPQAVAQKRANAFGLYDMHGNVWEWVQDWYHDDYKGAPTDGSAWEAGGEQKGRVLRGGSWYFIPAYLRSAIRSRNTPVYRDNGSGFRLARTLFTP